MEKNRKGSFVIDRNLLINAEESVLSAIFGVFYPLHIESNFFTNEITYYGLSSHFRRLPEGDVTPRYSCEITINEDESVSVAFIE